MTRVIGLVLTDVPEERFTSLGTTLKDCLAYLEKQKEHTPVQSEDEREYVRILKSIVSDFIRDKKPEDVAYYQKIYDWLDGRHVEVKEQMMSDAVEGEIRGDIRSQEEEPFQIWAESDYLPLDGEFKLHDNVKLILVKENSHE